MADEIILEPIGTEILKDLGGLPVEGDWAGATTEYHKKKLEEVKKDSAEQLDERDQKTSEHARYTYKQKVKATLTGEFTEEQNVAFVTEHDPEGKYSDEHQEAVRDIQDEAMHLGKYTSELKKMNDEYAEYEDKDSEKAQRNREEYNNAIEHKGKDDDAKKAKEDDEAKEMESVKAEIYTLTASLKEVDEKVVEHEKSIEERRERETQIENATSAFKEKYKANDDYIQDVKGMIDKDAEKDGCKIPTAQDAHKMSSKWYWGQRICPIILEAIAKGKYHQFFAELYESEIYELTHLGYKITKKKDRYKKDKKVDLDDKWNYVVEWDKLLSKAEAELA